MPQGKPLIDILCPKDRHKTNHLVRIPAELHEALKALAAKNDRPLTAELRRAINAHLKNS